MLKVNIKIYKLDQLKMKPMQGILSSNRRLKKLKPQIKNKEESFKLE